MLIRYRLIFNCIITNHYEKILWVVVPAATLILSGCGQSASNSLSNNNSNSAKTSTQSSAVVKFSDQPYFKNAYLISGDKLSADATSALAGFKMDKQTLPDGTVQIKLKAQEAQYHDQSYTLKAGEQLYFIDKFLGDDQGNAEANIGDDTAVVVDSQGNVSQPPAGF